MREGVWPFPQSRFLEGSQGSLEGSHGTLENLAPRPFCFFVLLTMIACTLGCAEGGTGSVAQSPPSPPSIEITVTPAAQSVLLGTQATFAALVIGSAIPAATWSVNGVAGGSAQTGFISTKGVYTAPADLPASRSVQITATSVADSAKSATAKVTISSDLAVLLSPSPSAIELGGVQRFQAMIQSNGRPDPAIRWSLSGPACPASCGTLDANGNYTAPPILPSSPAVNIGATSVADPSQQASASLTIAADFSLTISAPQTLQTSSATALSVTFNLPANSNPNETVSWSLSGVGCSSVACGVLSIVTAQNTVSATANVASFTAPPTAPQPDAVTVTVTPRANPAKQVVATIAILGSQSGALTITPASSTLAVNERLTLASATSGTATAPISWTVNGIAGGNASVGMICVSGSNPCQPISSSGSTSVDYVAPGAIPGSDPVTISVASSGTALTATATVDIINHVS